MTTVAVKDGVMAADSARWRNEVNHGPAQKVRNYGGLLVACSGESWHAEAAQRWFAAGQPQDDRPDIPGDAISVLALDELGQIWVGAGDLRMLKVNRGFAAIGSGGDIALGALAAGCDAYEAVRIACQFDSGSREPVFGMTNQEAG